MTTNQLIALLFPVAGAASAVAAGLLAKWIWVDRPRAKEARVATAQRMPPQFDELLNRLRNNELTPKDHALLAFFGLDRQEALDKIAAADRLVEQAHLDLLKAHRSLQEAKP